MSRHAGAGARRGPAPRCSSPARTHASASEHRWSSQSPSRGRSAKRALRSARAPVGRGPSRRARRRRARPASAGSTGTVRRGHRSPARTRARRPCAQRIVSQLRVPEDVRRVLAGAQAAQLQRVAREPLRLGEPAVERRAQRAQAHRVPAVERLSRCALRSRSSTGPPRPCHAGRRARGSSGSERRAPGTRAPGRPSPSAMRSISSVCQALERQSRGRERPVREWSAGTSASGVAEALRHLDRFLAHRDPALDRFVADHISSARWARSGAQGAVAAGSAASASSTGRRPWR